MTTANFQQCLDFVLKFEGGKSNDAHDPGGRTNQGITQASYAAYLSRVGLGPADVYTMSPGERNSIYRNEYWNRVKGDTLRPGEDLCVFDFAVNSGPARALDIWRRCGGGVRPAAEVIRGICAHRLSFLHALRTWRYFGGGWGRRVAACEATALQMAGLPLGPVLDKAKSKRNGHGTAGPAVTGAVLSGMAVLHWFEHAALWVILAFGVGGGLVAIAMAYSHWRQGQRVDALTSTIKASIVPPVHAAPIVVNVAQKPIVVGNILKGK